MITPRVLTGLLLAALLAPPVAEAQNLTANRIQLLPTTPSSCPTGRVCLLGTNLTTPYRVAFQDSGGNLLTMGDAWRLRPSSGAPGGVQGGDVWYDAGLQMAYVRLGMSNIPLVFTNTPASFGNQAANTFLAAPNGSLGLPTFRAILDADLPVLLSGHTLTSATLGGPLAAGGFTISGLAQGTVSGQALHAGYTLTCGTGLQGCGDFTAGRTLSVTTELAGLAGLASNGILYRNGAGVYGARTLVAGTGTTVVNGDLSAGNPAVNVTYGTGSNTATQGNDTRLPPAPSGAGGTLYDNGSAWTRLAAGTANYLLQANGAAAPSWVNSLSGISLPVDVQVYASGSGTWTRPSTGSLVEVTMYGGGGGGGSGKKGSLGGVSVPGGSGGGAGGYVHYVFRRTDLSASVSYVVGAAGSGGVAQNTTNTSGNNGSAGTDSTFGSYLRAGGGGAGLGGVTVGGQAGGTGGSGLLKGGDGQTNDGSCATAAVAYGAPTGGAQGGGVGAFGFASCSSAASAPGGTNVAGGLSSGGAGQAPGGWLPGGGGGGGDGSTSLNGQAGGAGGAYGGGGGGGGGINTSGSSGAGGAGGAGVVVVVTYG